MVELNVNWVGDIVQLELSTDKFITSSCVGAEFNFTSKLLGSPSFIVNASVLNIIWPYSFIFSVDKFPELSTINLNLELWQTIV